MPLVPIALTLASKFLPDLVGSLTGSKHAEKVAEKIVGVAKTVSGETDPKLAVEKVLAQTELQNNFLLGMRQCDVEIQAIHQKDRASARLMQIKTKSLIPGTIGIFTMAMFSILAGGSVYYILTDAQMGINLPTEMALLLGSIIGYAAAMAQSVIQYYFGSSDSSEKATDKLNDNISKVIHK